MDMQHKEFNGYDSFGYQRRMQRMRHGCYVVDCGLIGDQFSLDIFAL